MPITDNIITRMTLDADRYKHGIRALASEVHRLERQQRDLDTINKAVESGTLKLANAQRTLGRNINTVTGDVKKSTNALRRYAQVMAVIAVATRAVRFSDKFIEEGYKFQNLVSNLPFSIDRAAKATGGLVTNMELAAAASRSAAFGLNLNAESFANIAKAAAIAATKMGTDANDAIRDIILGMARMQPKILDNLGIIVRAKDAYKEYAAAHNKTTAELTAQEKQTAFVSASLKKLKEIAEGGTLSVDGLGGAYKRLKVAYDNFKKSVYGSLDDATKWDDEIKRSKDLVEALAEKYEVFKEPLLGAFGAMVMGRKQLYKLNEGLTDNEGNVEAAKKYFGEFDMSVKDLQKDFDKLTEAQKRWRQYVDDDVGKETPYDKMLEVVGDLLDTQKELNKHAGEFAHEGLPAIADAFWSVDEAAQAAGKSIKAAIGKGPKEERALGSIYDMSKDVSKGIKWSPEDWTQEQVQQYADAMKRMKKKKRGRRKISQFEKDSKRLLDAMRNWENFALKIQDEAAKDSIKIDVDKWTKRVEAAGYYNTKIIDESKRGLKNELREKQDRERSFQRHSREMLSNMRQYENFVRDIKHDASMEGIKLDIDHYQKQIDIAGWANKKLIDDLKHKIRTQYDLEVEAHRRKLQFQKESRRLIDKMIKDKRAAGLGTLGDPLNTGLTGAIVGAMGGPEMLMKNEKFKEFLDDTLKRVEKLSKAFGGLGYSVVTSFKIMNEAAHDMLGVVVDAGFEALAAEQSFGEALRDSLNAWLKGFAKKMGMKALESYAAALFALATGNPVSAGQFFGAGAAYTAAAAAAGVGIMATRRPKKDVGKERGTTRGLGGTVNFEAHRGPSTFVFNINTLMAPNGEEEYARAIGDGVRLATTRGYI